MEVLTPDESAKKISGIIEHLKAEDSGKFIDYNGNAIPFWIDCLEGTIATLVQASFAPL